MDFLLDFILHIDQYMVMIVRDYHAWTYAILFFIIFCETGLVVTPFLPVVLCGVALTGLQPYRVDMPDIFRVLLDRPVRREVAHIGNVQHRFCGPLFLKLVEFVDFILTIDIAAIIRKIRVAIAIWSIR
jgi:hypothetical protein